MIPARPAIESSARPEPRSPSSSFSARGGSGPDDAHPGPPARTPPENLERIEEREQLAEHLARRGICDERVLRAIRAVPRHRFVYPGDESRAYDDHPLSLEQGQTISQPYIVAAMTEALALRPESRVLEIGTGSGYQTAILAQLVDSVHTIEIVPELASFARDRLSELGYANVSFRVGDGRLGWPEAGPFDAILVTAAPESFPSALFGELAPGGRLCVPIGPRLGDQELQLHTRGPDGAHHVESLGCVRFVPLVEARERA